MNCDISRGRLEECAESVGGINAVYFVNNGDLGSPLYDATDTDVIDEFPSSGDAYRFDVRGASTYTETPTKSRENGTTFFEQVLELQLPKLTKEDHKTIKLLCYTSPHILIEDNNGNVFVAGLEYGIDVSGGSITTGGAMGDMSGYTLSFTGQEKLPANFLSKVGAGGSESIEAVGLSIIAGT